MRRRTLCSVLVVLTLIASSNTDARQHRISEDNLIGRLYHSDLFLIGKVLSVNSMIVNGWRDFKPNEFGTSVITKIKVDIDEVIAGEYSGSTITFYLTIGETERLITEDGEGISSIGIKPGDQIATPIRFSNTYGANITMPENTGVFKVSCERLYSYYHKCDIGLDKPIEKLRVAAKNLSMSNIVQSSDLVCLVEARDRSANNEHIYSYDIKSILKGDYNKDVIIIQYSSNQPVPGCLNKENRLLLLLRQTDVDQYDYAIEGRSIYIVDNNSIQTVRGMPMITSIDDIFNLVGGGE